MKITTPFPYCLFYKIVPLEVKSENNQLIQIIGIKDTILTKIIKKIIGFNELDDFKKRR